MRLDLRDIRRLLGGRLRSGGLRRGGLAGGNPRGGGHWGGRRADRRTAAGLSDGRSGAAPSAFCRASVTIPLIWLAVALVAAGGAYLSIERASREVAGGPDAGGDAARNAAGDAVVAVTGPGAKRLVTDLPDFHTIQSVEERKRRFFDFMRPIVSAENGRILRDRLRLLGLHERYGQTATLAPEEQIWLQSLADRYRVGQFELDQSVHWEALIRRVDIVPTPLALVQAANESGWGTSRFARQGNSLFGQWSFRPGTGMVPRERPAGSTYEVARFETVNEAVRSYLRNLNTHRAYLDFRCMRAQMRGEDGDLDAYTLAAGLLKYSQRREAYVEDLRLMMRVNHGLLGPA